LKRILLTCAAAAVALGTSAVLAASPQVDAAIKVIQAAGADAAKMEAFCDLIDLLDDAEDKASPAAADKQDPDLEKREDIFLTQLGSNFEAAWDVGGDLDEKSADGKAYNAAVDALAEKCQ
jgi:hypothetical protein